MSLSEKILRLLGLKIEGSPISQRSALVAAVLSICPGLGQQYAGHLYRGILLYVSTIVISWFSAIAFMYVDSTYISLIILTVPIFALVLVSIDAIICARKQPSNYRIKWYNRPWIYIGVFAFLLLTVNPIMDLLIGKHIVRAYLVSSKSMYPSILRHDLIVINKLANPARGDVVLIAHKKDAERNAMTHILENETIRRIVGMPGDKVEMRGQELIINEKEVNEPYVRKTIGISPNDLNEKEYNWGPEIVPENNYFVLSDARQYSFDSRVFGFIDREKIVGVATKVFWSWNFDSGDIKWERTAKRIFR